MRFALTSYDFRGKKKTFVKSEFPEFQYNMLTPFQHNWSNPWFHRLKLIFGRRFGSFWQMFRKILLA